jgi:hypothetical protein
MQRMHIVLDEINNPLGPPTHGQVTRQMPPMGSQATPSPLPPTDTNAMQMQMNGPSTSGPPTTSSLQPPPMPSIPAAVNSPSAPNQLPQTPGIQGRPGPQVGVSPQATVVSKQNRLTPVKKPPGLDPVTLLNERENR